MSADPATILPLVLIALAVLLLAAWLFSRLTRKARVIADETGAPLARDVLAEGATPAPRNQALIDAAPAARPVTPEPASSQASAPTEAAPPAGDDLTRIKGLGSKISVLLGELGVTSYAQIAAWDAAEAERIDAQLGRFAGRITRDQWVEQAKLLAAGDEATFTATFGSNG
ncbi:MAG: hypothetical protein ACKO1N_04110 [Erythrobacter sp.]